MEATSVRICLTGEGRDFAIRKQTGKDIDAHHCRKLSLTKVDHILGEREGGEEQRADKEDIQAWKRRSP